MTRAITTYIGLGSNLNHPRQQLHHAVTALHKLPCTRVQSLSPFYCTAPRGGPADQPDYINAAAKLSTQLSAPDLLQHLQYIENQQGRIRTMRWGPRTLDLDVLLYGNLCCHTPTLTLPHPRMQARLFVLIPLMDIAPTLVLPNGQCIRHALHRLQNSDCNNEKPNSERQENQ